MIDGEVRTAERPLVKSTDSSGVASAELSYRYGLDDGFESLCRDTGLQFNLALCLYTWPAGIVVAGPFTARDGLVAKLAGWEHFVATYVKDKWGGGETPPWPYRVYAQLAGVAPAGQLYAVEVAYCKFRTRWL